MPTDLSKSLSKAISLLDCFSLEHPELGVREVARLAGLSSSTAGRLLASLKEVGVLSQNASTHAYSLGPKVLTWAGIYANNLDVRSRSLPYLHELHHSTQETITLYIVDNSDRVCIERLESPHNVRITSRIGLRLPLYAGSAGKAMLAFLPPKKQEEIIDQSQLKPFTEKTLIEPITLRAELAKIRAHGYAISRGEWLIDASGVAAPIFDYSGSVIAAITISGPAQRFTDEAIERYAQMILPIAKQISKEMGSH